MKPLSNDGHAVTICMNNYSELMCEVLTPGVLEIYILFMRQLKQLH